MNAPYGEPRIARSAVVSAVPSMSTLGSSRKPPDWCCHSSGVGAVAREQLLVACPARRSGRGRGRRAGPCAATVLSRCATTSAVRPSMSRHRASWTRISLSESSALVASSSSRIGASRRIARASATRWRWPPDSLTPRSPTSVSKPSGRASANSVTCAASRGAADLGVGGAGPGERDVVPQRPVEHGRVLRHVGDQAAQVGLAQPGDVLAADQDAARRRCPSAAAAAG